ncbi:putative lysophospholipase L1 biosynthesis ABC-type transport system permease subunit [Bacillus sp. 153480037-1]
MMSFKAKITLLKCLESFFGNVIPIIIAILGMNNIIFHLAFDVKIYIWEILISITVTFLIALFISDIIKGIKKRKFFAYCKENEIKPTLGSWNDWKFKEKIYD